jgi:hypothetical protein
MIHCLLINASPAYRPGYNDPTSSRCLDVTKWNPGFPILQVFPDCVALHPGYSPDSLTTNHTFALPRVFAAKTVL